MLDQFNNFKILKVYTIRIRKFEFAFAFLATLCSSKIVERSKLLCRESWD